MELTEAEAEELHEAFDLFDKDGDGAISIEELYNVLALLGQDSNRDDISSLLSQGSNAIDRTQFVDLMSQYLYGQSNRPTADAELAAAFRVFDKDGDGMIGKEELRAALVAMGERVGQEEVEAMMKVADRNGDGQIDFEEFVAILKDDGEP